MSKQDQLIIVLSKSNDGLKDENAQFAKALVELKSVNDKSFERNIEFGLGGIALGVLGAALLLK